MDDFFSHDMKNDSPASTVVFGQDQSMQDFDKWANIKLHFYDIYWFVLQNFFSNKIYNFKVNMRISARLYGFFECLRI